MKADLRKTSITFTWLMSPLNVAERKADYLQQERRGPGCFKEVTHSYASSRINTSIHKKITVCKHSLVVLHGGSWLEGPKTFLDVPDSIAMNDAHARSVPRL